MILVPEGRRKLFDGELTDKKEYSTTTKRRRKNITDTKTKAEHPENTNMNPKQIEEARSLVKEANGMSKRSLFRWSPDYDTAATKYEKAATMYKNGKQFNDSVIYYCAAGDCYYKSSSSFLAGKNYENAGNVRRDEVCVCCV